MSHIKKFSYQDTSKRWLIPVAVFFTFFVLTLLLADAILVFKKYLPYYPLTAIIFLTGFLSFFSGNISGKFFYNILKKSIIINIIIAALFGLTVSFYFLKVSVFGSTFSHFNIYMYNRYMAALLIIIPAFFAGVLNCYFLNISTGDFLDEKNLLSGYISSLFLAISAGFILSSKNCFPFINYDKTTPFFSIITLFIMLIIIFINKNFSPEPLFARHYIDEEVTKQEEPVLRDDLFYTYLNFSYIITYLFLGHLILTKFFGSIYYYGQIYISVVFFSMTAGYIAGRFKKPSFWYVYSEMLFPVIFLSNLFLLHHFAGKISIHAAYIFAAIPAMIYGFSLRQTFENILFKYEHDKRFNIINFSLFILPIPVMFSISILQFSNALFYIILYLIAVINIIIPGIFLFNLKITPLKKIAYFIFTLIFIPAVLLLHLYFKIPFNTKPFITKSENFNILLNTNYNLPYITEKGEIKMYDAPAFYVSDSNIRNLKRATAAASLFAGVESKTLVIDSNQKFFSNPLFSLFPDLLCLDTVPARHLDNNRLPLSGRQLYIPIQDELVNFLIADKNSYDMILDSPNLLDQTIHPFRFSADYYLLIKKHLAENGTYAVIVDLKFIKDTQISAAIDQLNSNFRYHAVFLFSDIALIVSSNVEDSLRISEISLKRIEALYSDNSEFGNIFYSDIHPLNNIICTELDTFRKLLSENRPDADENGIRVIAQSMQDYYFSYEPDWYGKLISTGGRFATDIKSSMQKNSKILSLLKKVEYSESVNEYDKETEYLFELKKYAPYNDSIKNYVNNQLSYKEKYYQSEAMRLEKLKKWDNAAKLYQAILLINDENFEANYRLGILYITLQDLEKAFSYLDKALKLQKDNPHVLYQMGSLMFFSDKFKEAIAYLEEANKLNVSTAPLYMYLGISYENTGDNEKAKLNYEKAIQEDPNDSKLKTLLENLNMKMNTLPAGEQQGNRTNMLDDEQDENITIPVNKKAINARLKDSE